MAIQDWPEGERPREKLIQQGAAALSDTELLAIFLRTGSVGKTAVDLARDMLTHFGSLKGLLSANQRQFCALNGLGLAKYAQLHASLELASRHLKERMEERQVFSSPDTVASFLRLQLQGRKQEVFAALFLDSQNRLIAFETLFNGTIDSAAVYPREVVQRTLAHNAAALILAHNHPSGVAEPSDADVQITRRLQEALALVDVRLLDHLVVGFGETTSLAQRGLF